jgi:hypothetical protein
MNDKPTRTFPQMGTWRAAAHFVSLTADMSGCQAGPARIWTVLLLMMVLAASALPASAQGTNATPRQQDFSAFKIITDRNIFNPRRYARAGRRESRPTARHETFTLVGTMTYEKGPFAFFEGTSSDYHKVLKPAETIAGYTVTSIVPPIVKLAAGTNEVQLKVGMQMRREEEGEWQVASLDFSSGGSSGPTSVRPGPGPTVVRTASSAPNTEPDGEGEPQMIMVDPASQTAIADLPPDAAGTNAAADAASSATEDPVLRRLMQRREQELNR